MSDYTTLANIQAYFKGITFSANTTPTNTQVGNWITVWSNYIDAGLATVYSSIHNDDLKILEKLADQFVLVDVRQALGTSRIQTINGKTAPLEPTYREAMAQLKMFKDRELVLPNSSTVSSGAYIQSESYNQIEEHTGESDIETDQW